MIIELNELLNNDKGSFDFFLLNNSTISQEEREFIMDLLAEWVELKEEQELIKELKDFADWRDENENWINNNCTNNNDVVETYIKSKNEN